MQVVSPDLQTLLPALSGEALANPLSADRSKDHQEAAEKFESLIATQLVKELRRGVSDGFFGDGPGADVYNGWLDKHVGESLAGSWKLDLAGMVKTNLDSKQARLDREQAGTPGGSQ
jgi:Rod binding domain-containing protein